MEIGDKIKNLALVLDVMVYEIGKLYLAETSTETSIFAHLNNGALILISKQTKIKEEPQAN